MTLHGVDRNSQGLRDVEWIEILLVSQQQYGAWHGCEPAEERFKMVPQQRIGVTLGGHEPEALVERQCFGPVLPPELIDRAARCYLPQPEHEVLVRIDRADAAVELQKDLLRQILSECPVRQHAKRDTVNPGLVQSNERRKSGVLAGTCGGKQLIRLAWLDFWQRRAACT
jgi:hypothetical protein